MRKPCSTGTEADLDDTLMRTCIVFICLLASFPASQVMASQICATTLSELRTVLGEPGASMQWEETSMDDGKPLRVSVFERKGTLVLEFIKTGEGLWVEGSGAVCKTASDLEIRFDREQIRFGPATGWVLRSLMGNGGKFTLTMLGAEQLRIATTGWSGTFSARPR
jgi:hypothetical protein